MCVYVWVGGVSRLDGHGGELIVKVEREARNGQPQLHIVVGHQQAPELIPLGALHRDHYGDRDDKCENFRHGELVGDASVAVLTARW